MWVNYPAVDGDRVVYTDETFGEPTLGIRLHDLAAGTDVALVAGDFTNKFTDISGDRVVASGFNPFASAIRTVDLATGVAEIPVAHPSLSYLPKISGDRVVWQDDRDGNWDIYTLTITPPNTAPTADVGLDQIVESAGPGGTAVTLDGLMSSDPEDDPLTFTWTGSFPEGGGVAGGPMPTVTLADGVHAITLTVMDPLALMDSDGVTITVRDSTPPSIAGVTASPVGRIRAPVVSARDPGDRHALVGQTVGGATGRRGWPTAGYRSVGGTWP